MPEPLLVHTPPAGVPSQRLILLFHGVGADAQGLVPLGRMLAAAFPDATVASVPAPFVSDLGSGRQWFSVAGVTEANRIDRVAEAMPLFVRTVQAVQAAHGVAPMQTVLVGFSQGAIMALEAARAGHALAGRIVALAGRFAQPPQAVPPGVAFHLLHGTQDPVIPVGLAQQAAHTLRALGAPVTLDVLAGTGHGITQPMADGLVARLQAPPPAPAMA
jgi:phospholipase/carboxylesterase